LDKSTLFTNVTMFATADELMDSEDAYGNFVQGLYLEGAAWNVERSCLVMQKPKQLIQVYTTVVRCRSANKANSAFHPHGVD